MYVHVYYILVLHILCCAKRRPRAKNLFLSPLAYSYLTISVHNGIHLYTSVHIVCIVLYICMYIHTYTCVCMYIHTYVRGLFGKFDTPVSQSQVSTRVARATKSHNAGHQNNNCKYLQYKYAIKELPLNILHKYY